MKHVIAKFKCDAITTDDNPYGDVKTARFSAVTDGSDENHHFSEYTPWGNLEIGISGNVPAATFFEAGKEYILTFKKAK